MKMNEPLSVLRTNQNVFVYTTYLIRLANQIAILYSVDQSEASNTRMLHVICNNCYTVCVVFAVLAEKKLSGTVDPDCTVVYYLFCFPFIMCIDAN